MDADTVQGVRSIIRECNVEARQACKVGKGKRDEMHGCEMPQIWGTPLVKLVVTFKNGSGVAVVVLQAKRLQIPNIGLEKGLMELMVIIEYPIALVLRHELDVQIPPSF